jgi:uncharacterized tellurite resistance protein B-like protein
MDEERARKVCQLVAGIVVTDEDLDPAEEAFVDRMLDKFGLNVTDREVIFPLVDGAEAAREIKTLPEETQTQAMQLLVEAACADGKIAPEEREYLYAVADAVGLARSELDQRVDETLASL